MRRGRRLDNHRRGRATTALAVSVGLVAAAAVSGVRADPSDAPPSTVVVTAPPAAQPAMVPSVPQPVDEVGGTSPLPTAPGDHKLKFKTHVGDKSVAMTYLLHLPPNYESDGPAKLHPMLVFLHGSGENGADLAGVMAFGPPSHLKPNGGDPELAASFPMVVLAPQCPPRGQRWDQDAMIRAVTVLIDSTVRKARVDPDRIYITGLSMGGLGTWCVAEADPDRFAAVAPMMAVQHDPGRMAQLLRTVPVWASVGLNDEPKFIDGNRVMDAALAGAPVARRFSYLLGNGHDAFYPTYLDPDFYEWLLTHRRPGPAVRQALTTAPTPPVDTPAPVTPGHHFGTWATKVGDQPYQMDYVTYLPKGYTPGRRYPTMVFLREADTVGPDYNDVCVHGPNLALERSPSLQDTFPFVVVSPHLPPKCDWQTPGMTTTVLGLLDHLSDAGLGIDRDRVSVTGIDAGANGAWRLAADAPDRFSALVPVETQIPVPVADDQMSAVARTVPGRAYVVHDDNVTAGRLAKLAPGHDWAAAPLPAGAKALGELPVYADPTLLKWLAAQTRPTPPASANAAR